MKMVCVFATASLFAEGEFVQQVELRAKLAQTEERDSDVRFALYKKLLINQLQTDRFSEGDLKSFVSAVRIATTEKDLRQKAIESFKVEGKEIFASYDALISLASELGVDAINRNLSFHFLLPFDAKAIHAERLQLYFLQILELEEQLSFPVHGTEFWVREQARELTEILLVLENEIKAMQIKKVIRNQDELNLNHKELKFYWTEMVNLCHQFLFDLDSRWSQCTYDRLKILNLVFGKRFSFTFPYLDQDPSLPNLIDQFLPFILKHADLELVRTRFNQINHTLADWDLNFEWVVLHVKAAKLLRQFDQEKAKIYLEKARSLTEETLWCYPFSYHRVHWNAKQEEARRLVNEESY